MVACTSKLSVYFRVVTSFMLNPDMAVNSLSVFCCSFFFFVLNPPDLYYYGCSLTVCYINHIHKMFYLQVSASVIITDYILLYILWDKNITSTPNFIQRKK